MPTLVVYWTYAKFVAGTVVGPVAVRLFKKAARARSASGDPLRYAPERWSFVSGIVIAEAEVDVAKTTSESAANDLMLREADGGCAVCVGHL